MVRVPAACRRLKLKMMGSLEHADEPSKSRWYFAVSNDTGVRVSMLYVVPKWGSARFSGCREATALSSFHVAGDCSKRIKVMERRKIGRWKELLKGRCNPVVDWPRFV